MNDDYISQIHIKKIDNKLYFKTKDVINYMIDDYHKIISRLDAFDVCINETDYIDLYTLILLISFSNDFRASKYKFFLTYSSIEKISEINNPDLAIDKAKSLQYKKGDYENYKFMSSTNDHLGYEMSFKDIIYDEINNSFNISMLRQII